MKHIKSALLWAKYACIIVLSVITFSTVVNWFGATYIVAGNVVKRIR